MNLNVCSRRKIEGTNLITPLIVPSFSSKEDVNVGEQHAYLKDYLKEASLVSAYDLYYQLVQIDQIFETPIVFIDSGGFEKGFGDDLLNIYDYHFDSKDWEINKYNYIVNEISHFNHSVVLVNYDFLETNSIQEQVEKAKLLFNRHSFFISDFLCKPINNENYVDIDKLCRNIYLISEFSILGLTEKELGNSVLDRCINVYKIRCAMDKADLNIPIHIFGCIDPLNIITYFLCGADIFDGLAWKRFSFDGNIPIYFNSHAIQSGVFSFKDTEVKMLSLADNLSILEQLKSNMIDYINDQDLSVFGLEDHIINNIQDLLFQVRKGGI